MKLHLLVKILTYSNVPIGHLPLSNLLHGQSKKSWGRALFVNKFYKDSLLSNMSRSTEAHFPRKVFGDRGWNRIYAKPSSAFISEPPQTYAKTTWYLFTRNSCWVFFVFCFCKCFESDIRLKFIFVYIRVFYVLNYLLIFFILRKEKKNHKH